VGPNTKYTFQCTVESPSWVKDGPIKGSGTVAIDTGWRLMDGGQRVAYWVDDHGRHGQILVPESVRRAVDQADELQGHAHDHFNAACGQLRAWMAAYPQHVPPWMVEATETIAHWKSHVPLIRVARRLASDHGLWKLWLVERKAARLDLFGSFAEVCEWLQKRAVATGGSVPPLVQIAVYLEGWRRKDAHLYDWQQRERRYAENARTDLFRKVCQVARQYERVLIEKIDLPKLAKNASPEEKTNHEWLHRLARIAAPGDFAERIRVTCKGRAENVPPGANTRTCHKCNHVNDAWPHPERRVQVCAGCGAEWDRDENACRVMLALWYAPPSGEQSGDAPSPAPARSTKNTPDAMAPGSEGSPADPPVPVHARDRSQAGRQGREMTAGPA
jgi:hypothetical protein